MEKVKKNTGTGNEVKINKNISNKISTPTPILSPANKYSLYNNKII